MSQGIRRKVQIPRINHGNIQEMETLINEEALLFAVFLVAIAGIVSIKD